MNKLTPTRIEKLIFIIRGMRVMIDSDLATLYEVKTANLNKAVKRNLDRFPSDFMFQLNEKEFFALKESLGTDNSYGGRRTPPYVFTENGVAMLSGILTSKKAVKVNISIMRTFTKLRQLLASDETLAERMKKIERGADKMFRIVFERMEAIEGEVNQLKNKIPALPLKRKRIGIKSKK